MELPTRNIGRNWKSYILQYAPEGSKRLISQSLTEEVNDESRQFLILKDGQEVN